MIDRKKFYDAAREKPFGGTLTQEQVDGCNAILDGWECTAGMSDIRWLAYMLATSFWETNHTMQPVREAYYLGEPRAEEYRKTLRYYPWYGRGLVQLTWEDNYRKMGPLIGVDLIADPDLALSMPVAVAVMFEGMQRGMFTGVGLSRYFSDTVDDPLNARKIINGLDRATEIADIHRQFLAALTA